MENTPNNVLDTSRDMTPAVRDTTADTSEAVPPETPKASEWQELWEVQKEAGMEVLRAVVSGASATSILLAFAHFLRVPSFGEYYNFLVDHMAGNLSVDLMPLALLFASISCICSNWNGRTFIDQWACKPIIRLLTHMYGLASGVMLASTAVGLFVADLPTVREHMLYPAAAYFVRACFASSCFAMTDLAGQRFTKGLRDRNNFILALGLVLLAAFAWAMYKVN